MPKKKKTPSFEWNAETGKATCTITDGKHSFVGIAQCSEIDKDMMSEKTGCMIAQMRAEIAYYIHVRDNEILPSLKALQHLYNCMAQSNNFNKKSNEVRLLQRSIRHQQLDLIVVRQLLIDEKQNLKALLKEKDEFYQKIRTVRKKKDEFHKKLELLEKKDCVGQE